MRDNFCWSMAVSASGRCGLGLAGESRRRGPSCSAARVTAAGQGGPPPGPKMCRVRSACSGPLAGQPQLGHKATSIFWRASLLNRKVKLTKLLNCLRDRSKCAAFEGREIAPAAQVKGRRLGSWPRVEEEHLQLRTWLDLDLLREVHNGDLLLTHRLRFAPGLTALSARSHGLLSRRIFGCHALKAAWQLS